MASSVHTTAKKFNNSTMDTKYKIAISNSKVPTTRMPCSQTKSTVTTIKMTFTVARSKASNTKMASAVTESKASAKKMTSTATKSIAMVATTILNIDPKLLTANPVQEDETEKDEYSMLTVVLPTGSLILVSIALITALYFNCRRRAQIENTNVVSYADLMSPEDERGRYHTISTSVNTEIRNISEASRNISNCTASYKSPALDRDGYLTPRACGDNAEYDYVQ